MPKKRTTVFVSEDLIEPLEQYIAKSKVNLTELFDMFLRQLLGIEKTPNLVERVDAHDNAFIRIEGDIAELKQEVNEIKARLNA